MTPPASLKILKTATLTTTLARDKQANDGIPNQFGKAAGSTPFHAHDSVYLTYCSLPLILLLKAYGADRWCTHHGAKWLLLPEFLLHP